MQRCVGGQLRVPKGKLSACVGESTPKVTLQNIEEIATSGTTLIQMRVRRRRGRRELHATNAVDGCAKTIWQDIHENRAPGSEAGPYRGRKAYQGSRMMMMVMMIEMLFCLFPLLLFSLGCVFVKETNDIAI